ncbi:hypothetical protein [Marinobacter sp. JSM 1782161]|uniref:hypothetical protein n=1 Tax=Marinobacter sp. JSM 1782161 TaxID=2685906 RepID=UPI0014035481|nr:hypothetical protein [Marinobacter sp. JSM 1782161]
MKSIWMGVVVSGMLFAQLAYALPPEHETRRLMIAVEKAVADEKWGEAGEYLNRLQSLETPKPAEYAFYRGRVMFEAGHLNEAMSALETYVTQVGAEGEHYTEALELITAVEQTRNEQGDVAAAAQSQGDPVATIEPAAGDAIRDLQRLYLADTPQQALERHANSLLSQNAWRNNNGRVIRADESPDVQYRVQAGNGELQVQETRRLGDGRSEVISTRLSVYGINPLLRWDCPDDGRTCWIYDPRDGSRWLKLGGQPDTTQALARTLGDLIRRLQSPT